MSPLSNAYISDSDRFQPETFYPLHAFVCDRCLLVQLGEFESPESIFSDYAYFSSFSDDWLDHVKDFVEAVSRRFAIGVDNRVIEIASNDGYLLQYFRERGVPVLGIEPAANVAAAAKNKGIPTEVRFFGTKTAREVAARGDHADLLIANNVLAHVPDLNDFVAGMRLLLAPDGVASLEFPHLLRLMEGNQFDTIYHEHFSYFSLTTVEKIFSEHGLALFDVEELKTHGGSLRIFAKHAEDLSKPVTPRVESLKGIERDAGLNSPEAYDAFAAKAVDTKRKLLAFLIEAKRSGKSVAAYGAPAKGNTLLNYCGIRTDFIDYTVDRSPHKQGLYLPGTHIPIFSPERIRETRPDYLLILPWNLRDEIIRQMSFVREWGCRFVIPIPRVEIIE